MKKKTVNINKDLHKKIAIKAANEGCTIESIVYDAIINYLNEVINSG